MMGHEPTEAIWFSGVQGHWAVRNPDAFPIEIHLARCGLARGFLRASAGKKRPVKHGQFRVPGRVRDGDGKQAGIFVIHVVEFDALIRTESCEPQALSVEEVLR